MVDKVPNLITMFDAKLNEMKFMSKSPKYLPIKKSVVSYVVKTPTKKIT